VGDRSSVVYPGHLTSRAECQVAFITLKWNYNGLVDAFRYATATSFVLRSS
jgi:hypothetical protein